MKRLAGIAAWCVALSLGAAAGVTAADRHDAPTPAPAAVQRALADSTQYVIRETDNNQMGITITNYGFIGNNFVSRRPSMEYPLGAGFEHLVRGGLWIGAMALDPQGEFFPAVVTGALDGSQGQGSQSATEWSPGSRDIKARSTLPNSPVYNKPDAVSELDLIGTFSDLTPTTSLNNTEPHTPIGLVIRQENYAWSFADFQHFIVFHFVIKNVRQPLHNIWVGLYGEIASGNKLAYSSWPPSSGSGPGSWYSRKLFRWDNDIRLLREHYCAQLPVPTGCNFGAVPYWAGFKILTPPDSTQLVTLAAWNYAPGSDLRDTDEERYAIMSAGTIQDLMVPDLMPESGDPVALLAIGPFHPLSDPLVVGDSLVVDFAIVGGAEIVDIQRHSSFAQLAYDRDYIVPVPPESPRLHVVARERALDLYWDRSPEDFEDETSPILKDFEGYRVYVSEDRLNLKRVAQFDAGDTLGKGTSPNDTTGFNTGFGRVRLEEPATFPGVEGEFQYKYTIDNLRDGFKYFVAVTAYDLGSSEIESLESGIPQNKTLAVPAPAPKERGGKVTVFPNPYRVEARWDQGQLVRDHYLWFANLPERCRLRIYTLSGDQVFEVDFDGATYRGTDARGIYDPRRELDVDAPTLSGASYGWNMITREGQAVATGLYLYSVEDKATGDRQVGKFLIVKSDREDF